MIARAGSPADGRAPRARGRARARARVRAQRGRAPVIPPPADDWDCDFVKDTVDNCVPLGYDDLRTRNPNQANADLNLPGGDALGDWCDADDDADGVFDWTDGGRVQSTRSSSTTAAVVPNPGQRTSTATGSATHASTTATATAASTARTTARRSPTPIRPTSTATGPAICDNDDDGDYVRDTSDNCPRFPNPPIPPATVQRDDDGDGSAPRATPRSCRRSRRPRRRRRRPITPTPVPSPPSERPGRAAAARAAGLDVFDRQPPRVTLRLKATSGARGRGRVVVPCAAPRPAR